jgi:hypothetical protein
MPRGLNSLDALGRRRNQRRWRRRWRRAGDGGTALHQIHNPVAHFRLNGAELVFHVDAVLFAETN